ncbi:site-specific integrase [Roseovarius sp. LXJ103]|nr:site-specific integrase [Roseovarius carneus]PWE37387.1 integrase [Pelagicola sp. LXJ1103]
MTNRNGRYHARLVVPKDLRSIIGKTELRTPLGADWREALKLLPGAIAQLQHRIALAERQAGKGKPRYPLAPDQIAANLYTRRLVQDELMREHPGYASTSIDDRLVSRLRAGIAGSATNQELAELVGAQIEVFRNLGNLEAALGSKEWRDIARALCTAELEALGRVAERDEGDFSGKPTAPLIINAQPPEDAPAPVSLTKLWNSYVQSRQDLGYMGDGGRRQELAVRSLRKFLRHDNAAKITKKDMTDWVEDTLKEKQPSTINKVYLPTIRSLFRWATEKDMMIDNPAAGTKLASKRAVQNRERGYTTDEATKLLQAVHSYEPKVGHHGKVMEAVKVTAAKRWVPWLCAFTGARVAEITQLRREDIREVDGDLVIRITPEAGGTKSGQWRDVPLHPQIAALGFPTYLDTINSGPIFHNATEPKLYQRHAKKLANRIGDWLNEEKLVPGGVQPSHGWRHRFKTVGRELAIQDRVLDAIQGHAARTAGDAYGDVTLATKKASIKRFPDYSVK